MLVQSPLIGQVTMHTGLWLAGCCISLISRFVMVCSNIHTRTKPRYCETNEQNKTWSGPWLSRGGGLFLFHIETINYHSQSATWSRASGKLRVLGTTLAQRSLGASRRDPLNYRPSYESIRWSRIYFFWLPGAETNSSSQINSFSV